MFSFMLLATLLSITRATLLQQQKLNEELSRTMAEVKVLQGLLPICCSCKRIRDNGGKWEQMESYIHRNSEADFSHGLCPECAKKLCPQLYPSDIMRESNPSKMKKSKSLA
jgi:hypothetical protein